MNENAKLDKININWYPGHMAKTKRLISEKINLIDIVIEVVDARMPYSSRIKDLDHLIKGKPRIMLIAKYDLCDKEETNKWVSKYTKDNVRVVMADLTDNNVNIGKILNREVAEVMKEINDKRLSKGLEKRRTRALIIGIPNVGKSTLINRLVGKKVAHVGNKPGITKDLSWIRINDQFELLDTPGILWPKLDDKKVAFNLASLTAIKEEILPLDEVSTYIIDTLYKYYPNQLEKRYGITDFDIEDVLPAYDTIGQKFGCLIKGGEIDYDKVISIIINDIKNGNIKGITFDRFTEE